MGAVTTREQFNNANTARQAQTWAGMDGRCIVNMAAHNHEGEAYAARQVAGMHGAALLIMVVPTASVDAPFA